MCIIAYKPLNVAFPEENILQTCFDNNDDGAGFMYTLNGEVHIHKGYETFEKFMAALNKARAVTGDKVPYVMHFRIATQGYERTMTHPFPLSSKMENLKRLHYKCSIGVAHNGILDITSDGAKTYSDTMKFITDYLSNIIQSYDWYKNKRTKKLIEYLIDGSRLAILDAHSHCELMGRGWEENNGIYYSNHSWAYRKYACTGTSAGFSGSWNRAWWDEWDDDLVWDKAKGRYVQRNAQKPAEAKEADSQADTEKTDPWAEYYSKYTGKYYFYDGDYCPVTVNGDYSYCEKCSECSYCQEYKAMQNRHFHLDKVKRYLDGVFSKERRLNTYSKCAQDIYKVFSCLEWIRVRDVESWLRGGKIHIESNPYKMCELAEEFSVDIFSLTQGKERTEKDVYFWALATAIWVYGGMGNINPEARRSYASDCDERPLGAMYGGRK